MIRDLSFSEIHPFIRNAHILNINLDQSFVRDYKSYDCRLFYVYNSTGIIKMDGAVYNVSAGELFLWQPGVTYSLICNNSGSLNLLSLSFDFTQNNSDKNLPIGPKFKEIFNEAGIIETVKFNDIEAFNEPLHLKNMSVIEEQLFEIINEFAAKKRFFDNRISAIFTVILSTLARSASNIYTEPGKKDHISDLVIQYMHHNYDKNITNRIIRNIFRFHPNYINKTMVQNTGKSLHQYLISLRISKAVELLQNTDMRISEIAYKVGFGDANHFTKQFRLKT